MFSVVIPIGADLAAQPGVSSGEEVDAFGKFVEGHRVGSLFGLFTLWSGILNWVLWQVGSVLDVGGVGILLPDDVTDVLVVVALQQVWPGLYREVDPDGEGVFLFRDAESLRLHHLHGYSEDCDTDFVWVFDGKAVVSSEQSEIAQALFRLGGRLACQDESA